MLDAFYVTIYEDKGKLFITSGNKRQPKNPGTHKRTFSFNRASETIANYKLRVEREVEQFIQKYSRNNIKGWEDVRTVLNALSDD